jgi:1-deoxy-D-xylulose-5-phosphate synthase
MSVLTPSDEAECRQALTTAFRQSHPVTVRYPRGAGVGVDAGTGFDEWPWGKGVVRRSGSRIAVLAFGTLLHPALAVAETMDATVVDMRFVKPLDADLVLELARTHEALVTVEEGCVMGGAGSAVAECLAAAGVQAPLLQLGLPDVFTEHGDPARLLSMCGLDAAGIEASIRERFGSRPALLRPAANH